MKITGSEFQLNRTSNGSIVCFVFFCLAFILNTAEISAAPQVISMKPSSVGQRAQAKTIGVYGSGFQCGMSVTFSDPTIQAVPVKDSSGNPVPYECEFSTSSGTSFTSIYTNVQFVSTSSTVFTSSNVFLSLNTFTTTSIGSVTATFTNPPPPYGDGASGTGVFQINPAPTLTSVDTNPLTVFQGTTITATVTGAGFQNGSTLSFPGGGITVNSFNVNGTGTSGTASLTISSTIFPSAVPMTLTNPDGGVISIPSAFSVLETLTGQTPALAVYEDGRLVNGRNTPFNVFWNGDWSDEGNILPSSIIYTPREMTLKAHPFLFQQIAGHPVGSTVEFQIWSNETWGNKLSVPSLASASKNYDMAFETQSGKGLVVYGKSNGMAYRQIFQDTAGCSPNPFPCWGPETPMVTVINSATPHLYWAKLVSNPGPASNEIIMAYEDSSGRLFIRSWNGSSFSAEYQVPTSTPLRTTSVPFDIAYMQSSQTGLLAWAETNNGTPKSCTWDGNTNACTPTATSPAQTGSLTTTSLYTVQLAPDPASDQMALGTIQATGSSNGILKVQIWNGSAWPTNPYPADLNGVQQLSQVLYFSSSFHWNIFNLIWKNNPRNVLFAIYNHLDPATVDGGLNYQSWDLTAGWSGNLSVPGIPPLASGLLPYFSAIDFNLDPRTGDILGGMRTKNPEYFFSVIRWDESNLSWQDFKQITSDFSAAPFGLSFFRNFPTIDPATLQTTDPVTGLIVPAQQGSSIRISVSGTLFQSGAVLSIPGFTLTQQLIFSSTSPTTLNGNTLSATGNIASDVIPGVYDVMITNPDRSLAVAQGVFAITASTSNTAPVIYAMTPNNRGQGAANQTLTLSGYNLTSSFSLSFAFPGGTIDPDIVVTTPQPVNPVTVGLIQQVSLQVNVRASAAAGPRSIVISMGGQTYTFPSLFTVNYGPSITDLSPGTIVQGASQVNMSVSGTDFQPGASIRILNGASSLGWDNAGGSSSNLFKDKMTGNLFYFSGPSSGVSLYAIVLKPTMIDPSQTRGQVAIYDNYHDSGTNTDTPGNLIAKSNVQTFIKGVNSWFYFGLSSSSPVILPAPGYYWVLFNVDGLETILSRDENRANCSINGYTTPCQGVSKSQPFGSWQLTGGTPSSWTNLPGERFSIDLFYNPIIGSTSVGANSLGVNAYQNQMTGSNILNFSTTLITSLYAYIGTVDPLNKAGSLAVYNSAGAGSSPGALIASANNTILTPNSFNKFSFNRSFPTGTYWVLANVNGAGTTLNYDSGVSISQNSVQGVQAFGTWPSPSTTTSTIDSNKRYSMFATGANGLLGNLTGTVSEGPDSNQMTGSRFTAALDSMINGISFYVNTVDAVNQLGSAAIYDNNPGTNLPGNLVGSTAVKTLIPGAFNSLPLSATINLSAGTYWILVNVNGVGTTLTFDDGTAVDGIKMNNSFSNSWPDPGGAGWTLLSGRRYAVSVMPDVTMSSNFVSGNQINMSVTADPYAFTGARQVCVTNPDGGEACVSLNANNEPYFQIIGREMSRPALTAYGRTLSSFPAYRKWVGSAPWDLESNSSVSSGSAPLWSVLRAYPHQYQNGNTQNTDPRSGEKILGTISSTFTSPSVLTLQVWNGVSSWGSSLTLTTSPTFSRSFDIAYESSSGRGLVVYGISGNPVPQSQIWNGTGWVPQAVTVTNTTGNTILWVRLESNPNSASNEVILSYLSGDVTVVSGNTTINSNIALHTLVWDGSSFGNEKVFNLPANNLNLCGNCTPPILSQPFDIAYEHLAGKALLAWGETGNSTPNYIIWNGTAWLTTLSANPAAGDTGTTLLYLKLAGDPNSNRIALGSGTINGQYYVQLWNGVDWGNPGSRLDSAAAFSVSGEWSQTPNASPPSGGSRKESHLASDSAEFTFAGTEIDLIGQKDANLGVMNVFVDGQLKDHIDQYYPVPTERMVLFNLTNLNNTTHTLKLSPSGLRNNHAGFPGGTPDSTTLPGIIYGSPFMPQKDSTVSMLGIYLGGVDPSVPGYIPGYKAAIYSDNNGKPGNLLAQAARTLSGTAGTWDNVFFSVNLNLKGGTTYWILVIANSSGTTFSYSNSLGTPAINSISSTLTYATFPADLSTAPAWNSSTGIYYSLYAAGPNAGLIDVIVMGQAPSVAVDSVHVKNTLDAPAVISSNLLYFSSPALPGAPDPTAIGRNFDLAWEKDTGRLITAFGSANGINTCGTLSTNPFPYATRFRTWSPLQGAGWSMDALVPLAGNDLVPRWIQLTPDTSSNDLFLGISGQLVTGGAPCPSGSLTYHLLSLQNGTWVDKESLSSSLSGFFKPLVTKPGNGATAYTESFMTMFNPDSVSPAAVQDLTLTGVTNNSVTLQWRSSGDDGSLGKAAGYTIYYSTSSTFSNSTPLQVSPVFMTMPAVLETYSTTINLAPGTYYFAITATDKAGNRSLLSSNPPSGTVPASGSAVIAPAAIQDLMIVPGTLANNSIQLTWTAPMISTSYSGTGAAYDFRWSASPIVDDTSFNSANPVLAPDGRNGLPSPHLKGTREFFDFIGLPAGTVYFAIKTCAPLAMDPVTFRCTGSPSAISPINSNSPVSVNNGAAAALSPPSDVSDLTVTGAASTSMTLRWTAPGNSGQTGTAARYDIRVSTAPILSANFGAALPVSPIPLPLPYGTVQSFSITNLLSNTTSGVTYYFAIKTVNTAGTPSNLSNVAAGTTIPIFDSTPPAAIASISLVPNSVTSRSVILSWTATGDDGTVGMATQYDIRYSELPIVDDAMFNNAAQIANPPVPGPSGTSESFTVGGLKSNTQYYFAIKAIDKGGNASALSTCSSCPIHTALYNGYNLVSVPYNLPGPNDPVSVFGNDLSTPVTVYQWNGAYAVPPVITDGVGYFLYSTGQNSVLRATDSSGNLLGAPETSPAFVAPLLSGWNIIGNPYLYPIYLKDTCVKRGSGPSVSFATAVTNGWVENSIYSYDGSQYTAEIYSDPANILSPALLGPWKGYWFQLKLSDTSYSLIYLNTPGACP